MNDIQVKSKEIQLETIEHELNVEEDIEAKYFYIIKNIIQKGKKVEYLLIVASFLLALMLRITVIPFESADYHTYLIVWYNFIHTYGGFAALKYTVGNYTPFYLYFIALITYIPLSPLVLFKALSIFFDFVLAFGVYLIVKLKYQSSYVPLIASLLVLFAPTIFLNSALWGQCDVIYTAFAVMGLYFFLRKRPGFACLFFGLSLSFKPQAAFLLPLLLFLWMKREVYLKHLVIIPASYLVMIFPAFLLGRPFTDLLTIYLTAAGDVPYITLNAPNFWQWFPNSQFSILHDAALVLTMACIAMLYFVVYARQQKVSSHLLILLALIFVLCVPFFMPQMHERYFYMADVISIIYAFYVPRQFYLAIAVQLASLFAYLPFLFVMTVINLSWLPFLILGAMIITIGTLIKALYFADHQHIATQVENEAPLENIPIATQVENEAPLENIPIATQVENEAPLENISIP
ncbi:hypothetical protein [Dictyobacter formicarum]|uniref:Glycosyltransferase RgtA/B/C/D-like domain-containing protein n=1 Tax=Dictyobacter formicarum TaxID=2778368 RepID=A0ABQ3VHC2_9CHLR|nr:hypothetical protein [Dictyobacter formicarum]GHO85580.1 hypothetical protein KSZ_35860 [Dictyobacter formicarum]